MLKMLEIIYSRASHKGATSMRTGASIFNNLLIKLIDWASRYSFIVV